MTVHKLKCWPIYFDAIQRGEKTFEARLNDRDFKMGDHVVLMRTYEHDAGTVEPPPSGSSRDAMHELHFKIGWILTGNRKFGIEDGYCVFSLISPSGSQDHEN